MGMYAKLMARITESSLMDETIPVRYTFVMMLAIADPHGYVIGTDVAIARRLNMPLQDFKECVAELMEPDPDSNSKEEEGRRVILSDAERGYFVVNYAKYRDTRDEEQRREYMKEYMRKRRAEKDVAPVNNGKLALAKEDEPAKAKVKSNAVVTASNGTPPELRSVAGFDSEWKAFQEHRRKIKKPLTDRASELTLDKLSERPQDAVAALQMTMEKGWASFEWEWFDKNRTPSLKLTSPPDFVKTEWPTWLKIMRAPFTDYNNASTSIRDQFHAWRKTKA